MVSAYVSIAFLLVSFVGFWIAYKMIGLPQYEFWKHKWLWLVACLASIGMINIAMSLLVLVHGIKV